MMAFRAGCWVSLLGAVQGMQLHGMQPQLSESAQGWWPGIRPLYYPILASHHKTGSVMLLNMEWSLSQAMKCETLPEMKWNLTFGPDVPEWREQWGTKAPCFELFWHWEGGVPGENELPTGFKESRVVHLVRNPMSMVASAYLYHKTTCQGEKWNEEPLKTMCSGGPNVHLGKVCNVVGWSKFKDWISGELSYTQALQRLPQKYGIFFELLRSEPEISTMMSTFRVHQKRSDVKNVCLEDITRNSTAFHSFWSDALKFFGFPVPEYARDAVTEAIERNDIHSAKFENKDHVVNHTIESSDSLLADIASADIELMGGQLLALTNELGCIK